MKTVSLLPKRISEPLANALRSRISAVWNFPALDRVGIRILLAVFILGACYMRAYIGLWGVRMYLQDAFQMLDGGWRILNGQIPHIDFYTGLGPVSYLIAAGGIVLAKGNADGLAYGQALFGCVMGLWAYGLGERRLRGLATILFCMFVVLLGIVPTVIGGPPVDISPGATYNRYSYALVALIVLEAVSACSSRRKHDELWGGLSTGAALGTLLFLKISFFMGTCFLLAAFFGLRPQTKERWSGIAGGFAATALAFLSYLHFDAAAVYKDIQMVAHTKHVMVGWYLAKDVALYAIPFLLLTWALSETIASQQEKLAIRIAGLGILQVRKRAARMGRNPATGEAIKIPAKKVVKFRVAKAVKDAIVPPKKK